MSVAAYACQSRRGGVPVDDQLTAIRTWASQVGLAITKEFHDEPVRLDDGRILCSRTGVVKLLYARDISMVVVATREAISLWPRFTEDLSGRGKTLIAVGDSLPEKHTKKVKYKKRFGPRGGSPPIGYRWIKTPAGASLDIDEDGASVIRTIFSTYIEEKTISETIKRLAEMGITSPRGGPIRQSFVIDSILTREFYTGNGAGANYRCPKTHEPIVSKEDFDAAQVLIKSERQRWKKAKDRGWR